jgi:hypothetical protein
MSFRLFVYYCAICGGNAAFFGWALGRIPRMEDRIAEASLRGMFLGILVAFGLSLVDALFSLSLRHFLEIAGRVSVAVLVGLIGGLLGGAVGQALYGPTLFSAFLIFGWTITGLLIGLSIGTFDLLSCLVLGRDTRSARRKLFNGALGGTLGGILGGLLFVLILNAGQQLFGARAEQFWIPSVTGFVALGICIGLMIGLCQVMLSEAWLKVEKGFRAGRAVFLTSGELTIGRGEGCDIGLFGDAEVEKLHARIKREGNDYVIYDEGTPSGTWVNDERVEGSMRLESGDLIRVGKSVVRFGERKKRRR